MKTPIICLLMLLSSATFATEKTEVKSKIEKVTVFLNGAQVKRSASAPLVAGRNKLHFTGLPLTLDNKSLQFSAEAPITILSINHQITYEDESKKDSAKISILEKKLKSLTTNSRIIEATKAVYLQEKNVLLANTSFGGSQNGVSPIELEKGVNLIRNRLLEINKKILDIENQIAASNVQRQKIRIQLEQFRNKAAVKRGEVVIILNCDAAMRANMTLNYTVSQASWKPYYDLRIKDVSSPLELIYKAKVVQNTGEDWNKVKIALSTGDPSQSGQLPALAPWFLNFTNRRYSSQGNSRNVKAPGITGTVSGIVINSQTGEAVLGASIIAKNQMGEVILGTSSAFDGKFSMDLKRPANRLEISYVGFNNASQYLNNQKRYYRVSLYENRTNLDQVVVMDKRMIERNDMIQEAEIAYAAPPQQNISSQSINIRGSRPNGTIYLVDGMKVKGNTQFMISRNPTTFNFTVSDPYDIPADGNDYVVTLQEFSLDAEYLYKAVPKLEEHAYLNAAITDWEKLSLRNGEAGIYYEGTYMGETFLNVDAAGDTLEISLGKDEDIAIQREEVVSKEGARFISSNKEEAFHYRISVRNNKQAKIKLQIKDQYPVSGNDKIKVKQDEKSGGKLNEESGLIEWDLEIDPSQEKEINLKYRIIYPKNSIINLY